MAPLRSRVWQRHGQLRLYISGGGLDIGWCDPRTGRFELHQPTLEPEFWQAVHAGCDQLLRDGRLREAVIHRPVPPRMTARPLTELVAPANPPGAAPELEPSPPAAVANRPEAARAPSTAPCPMSTGSYAIRAGMTWPATHLVRRPGPDRGSCGRSTRC